MVDWNIKEEGIVAELDRLRMLFRDVRYMLLLFIPNTDEYKVTQKLEEKMSSLKRATSLDAKSIYFIS